MRPYHWANAAFLAASAGLIAGCLRLQWSWWWLAALGSLHLLVITIGVMRMRWNFFYRHHHHGVRTRQEIALTFDDGPAETTTAILDILAQEGVPATFFVIGDRAQERPELLQRIVREGHLVGNHSQHHGASFDWKRPAAMLAEMDEANETIRRIAGVSPKLFRPPYGITNPSLARAIGRSGMESIGWSLRSYDTNYKDADALLRRTLRLLQPGDVILLHDRLPLTAAILTKLIRGARERGFTFVPLDRLLRIQAYA